ncbi:MAG: MBL fold metallo-hydrolase [Devosia sp.]
MITPDIIATGLGDVVLQPIHHATFMLSWGENSLVFDPVGGAARLAGLPRPNLVILTHEHPDHYDEATLLALAEQGPLDIIASPGTHALLPEALKTRATQLANGETAEKVGVVIEAVPAYNTTPERLQFHPRGLVNGYVLDFGGTRIYNASDTEVTPELAGMTDIAVALVPMNLPYTMTGPQAADGVRLFRPRIVYPFHYLGGSENQAFARALEGEPDIEVRLRDWYEGQ